MGVRRRRLTKFQRTKNEDLCARDALSSERPVESLGGEGGEKVCEHVEKVWRGYNRGATLRRVAGFNRKSLWCARSILIDLIYKTSQI